MSMIHTLPNQTAKALRGSFEAFYPIHYPNHNHNHP